MFTSSPVLSQDTRGNPDTASLSWVIGEIREALIRSTTALYEAVTRDPDTDARRTALRHARGHLHQAHGALQMVDIDGVAIISETVEDLLEKVDAGQLSLTQALTQAIGSGCQALVEYLEDLLAGEPHQPVRLFPYYRLLLQAGGAERIHPADLFFPELAMRPRLPVCTPVAIDLGELRQCFEKALLLFLKSRDREAEIAHATELRKVIGQIERAQDNPQARAFWWVLHGFADAVSSGGIQNEAYVKQIFGRINLQIRRLSRGSSSIAERLLRDALFFIAQAGNPSEHVLQIRRAYQLDGLVPPDYETARYGRIDAEALAAARARLAQAKKLWNRFAAGDAGVVDSFAHEMQALAEAGARLDAAPLAALLRELSGIARQAASTQAGDSLALEVATSLLFVENALRHIGRLPDDFAGRVESIVARLRSVLAGSQPERPAPWLDHMSHEAQQRQTMTALAAEMQASLRQVETLLEEYFRDPAQHGGLGQIDRMLCQIEGALAILDQDDAMHAAGDLRSTLERFVARGPEAAPDTGEFQRVVRNVGALSFFFDTLGVSADGARHRFLFDDEQGIFHAKLLESGSGLAPSIQEHPPSGQGAGQDAAVIALDLSTVEEELAYAQQQSAELAMSLSMQPGNRLLRDQLRQSLERIRLDATLVDNREANYRARTGIDILKRPDFGISQDALAQIIIATVPAVAADLAPRVEPAAADGAPMANGAGSQSGAVMPDPRHSDSNNCDSDSDSVRRIGDQEISVALHNIYLAEADPLLRVLALDMAEWRHEPERQVDTQSIHAAHTLAGSSATVRFDILHEVARALESVLHLLAVVPVRLTAFDYDILEQSIERMRIMLRRFALGEMPVREPEHARLLASLAQHLEARITAHSAIPERDAGGFTPAIIPGPDSLDAAVFPQPEAQGGPRFSEPAIALSDELDAELLPVFIEEGRDLLPQAGQILRGGQGRLADAGWSQSLLRLLHTLKGSARMAGAMRLGQHLHDMETRVENLMRLGVPSAFALEDLLIRYDQASWLFEQLQDNGTPAASGDKSSVAGAMAGGEPSPAPTTTPVAPAPLVRVRADVLDRLVNQAGEVSISRSRLENEVGTLRESLSELTENVVRLRDQLREMEMQAEMQAETQAETQINSRKAHAGDREFDPLEFDRFTRLQELTRMMAESVEDIGSVQQNLSRTLNSATTGLAAQARLTRDLQQDLMRVRMVQFASISERLFRVTRQAAKEVDKRVNLDIRGGAVEIDRGVLEKMTGPLEHLLRNAIVHGIETRAERRAAGKDEIGELLVEVSQEGNEFVIRFSDDGRGLDIGSIRTKARQVGLLADDSMLPDAEVSDLIFHPGLSTAQEITELAGRGVGMDVVRSEAAALGGRVEARSEPGGGTRFTIHLPLTLAVTQVVLVSSGGKTYAVPSVLVEQVQRLKANSLAAAYSDGNLTWQGQPVPLHYLPALLDDSGSSPPAQPYSPLLIVRSGGNDRMALQVDQVLGNREVVVKNIGPQLARMAGIAGATVLGSGDIVLILNPVPLAQRAMAQDRRRHGALGKVVSDVADGGPVQGLRRRTIVMVVDDSLTVRRVTQRVLAREGYQVMLAKDGVDALEQLQTVTPDVMLVDIEMPRMNGFDLTRNMRGDERTRHIPIIMITSRTALKHRNFAMELGVNEYLGKPYQDTRLLELVAGFVRNDSPIS